MKKVSTNLVEEPVDAYLTNCPESDRAAMYLDLFKYNATSSSAAASLPLRVIYPMFGPGVKPECILDGGAQIIVMRRDVWECLNVPIAAGLVRPMEAANSTTTMTRGLIRNHPVQLGPITIHLQIQVMDDAPFKVLLSRPFFDVTNCSEISTFGSKHEIHIKDPMTGQPYVFATQHRIVKTPRECVEHSHQLEAVNFHQ
jgi:hypothetical protein